METRHLVDAEMSTNSVNIFINNGVGPYNAKHTCTQGEQNLQKWNL